MARAPRRTIGGAITRPLGSPLVTVRAIFTRELAGAFGRPAAWTALAVFYLLVGGFSLWLDDLFVAGVASMRGPLLWMAVGLLILVPALTMRSLAEERRAGTLQLLATLPVSPVHIVLGKWLAVVAVLAVALGGTATWPLALSLLGPLDPGPVLSGYLGLLLAGASLSALGIAASAVTDSQIVAFLLALLACALPWVAAWTLPLLPDGWAATVAPLTLPHHLGELARGVVDSRSLVYFGVLGVLGLRIAVHALELRRLG